MGRNQTERAVIDLVLNGQQAQTTLRDLSLAVSRTRSELMKMREADDPKLYAEKLEQMHSLIAAQRDMTGRINDTTTAWGRFKKEAATLTAGVVGGNVITFAMQSLVALIPDTIDKTMKLNDSIADIEKSTGLSADGVKKLNKELKALDTRTANKDLRDIAVAGGQLGVANDQLKDFVENTDHAVVALGDEFTGGVEQVAKEIGGIAKLFDETKNQAIGKSINDIGSALNELGAAGAATAPEVAQFTLRMGQLGELAPSVTETMGMGAAFQELGVTAEIASSGLSQILLKSSQASGLFAQQIGMTKKETEALINSDPNAYLLKLAESLRGMSATQVAQRMKDLKIESEESIKVMSLLANQTDFVREKQTLAAKAMQEGTSLIEEFAKKNHQLARDLKDLQEWFNGLFTSQSVNDFVVSATHQAVEFTKVLPKVIDFLSGLTDYFGLAAGATLMYYGATLKATAATIANTLAEGYRKVAYEVGYRWLLLQTTATAAYEVAVAVLTGEITLQTAVVALARNAWASFTAVLVANPIGAVVAVLTALGYAMKYFSENSERALAVEREKTRINQDLQKAIKDTSRAQQDINEKIGDYNNLSKTEQDNLEKTILLKKTETVARLTALQARARENALQSAPTTAWQQMKIGAMNTLTLSLGMGVKRDLLAQEQENAKSAYDQAMAGSDQLQEQIDNYTREIEQIDKIKNRKTKTGGSNAPKTIVDPDKKDKKSQAQKDEDELQKMLAEARRDAMTAEGAAYEKSVAAFAEKYTKMYGLAKNDGDKIKEIQRLSLLEWAGIEKKLWDDEEKAQAEHNKKLSEEAVDALKSKQEEEDLYVRLAEARGQTTPEQATKKRLESEETYLMAELLIRQSYGQETLSIEKKLNDNLVAQEQARHDKEMRLSDQRKQATREEQQLKTQIFNTGVNTLKSFFAQSSGIQRAALIAQKAWAIGEVLITLQKQIQLINLAASVQNAIIPFSGEATRAIQIGIASASAAGSIAQIASQNYQAPAFMYGGYTDSQNPSGFYSRPTFFSDKRYTVAENSRPEFVISNPALQVPLVADFTRLLDVAQRTGDYSGLTQSLAAAGGSQQTAQGASAPGGNSDAILVQMLRQLQENNQKLEDVASRPIENNYRNFERYQNRVQEIRTVTSL